MAWCGVARFGLMWCVLCECVHLCVCVCACVCLCLCVAVTPFYVLLCCGIVQECVCVCVCVYVFFSATDSLNVTLKTWFVNAKFLIFS